MSRTILVTGGAGYIGSHTSALLIKLGHKVVVFDNLSTGFREAIPTGATFVQGDVIDSKQIEAIARQYQVDSAVHFAGSLIVSESVAEPLKYYENNVAGSIALLQGLTAAGVRNLVFSSTAAVYGETGTDKVREDAPTQPVSPYGKSKRMVETIIEDTAKATGLKYVILRYFNVAGASIDGTNGSRSKNATHLIKVACEAALGRRASIQVFGTDYPTPDGTGVRDYIHIEDLAAAHSASIDYLHQGGVSQIFNCGYGKGYSVLQVLDTISQISGQKLLVEKTARREGDSPSVIADASRLRQFLNWVPRFDNLEVICRSSLEWEQKA